MNHSLRVATRPAVLVVGSVNQDVTVRVQRFPGPGETLLGDGVTYGLGGKGANQAVAAARTGVPTGLLASVGDDAVGRQLVGWLDERGVDTSLVTLASGVASGTAHILVDAAGENQIVVVPAANQAMGADRVAACSDAIVGATIVVVQGEIPWPATELALSMGRRTVLNLAPAAPLAEATLAAVDVLVVNESEAGAVLARTPPRSRAEAVAAVADLARLCRSAVLTLGADGAVWASAEGSGHAPAARVEAVDTTGAGDAFVGVLAAALAAGATLEQAVRAGVAAASQSVLLTGAAMSYPAFSLAAD